MLFKKTIVVRPLQAMWKRHNGCWSLWLGHSDGTVKLILGYYQTELITLHGRNPHETLVLELELERIEFKAPEHEWRATTVKRLNEFFEYMGLKERMVFKGPQTQFPVELGRP